MSQTLQDRFGKKIPWVLGNKVRIPRVRYPKFQESNLSLPSPSRSMILMMIYAFLFYLIMGGIYIYIRDPIALGADQAGKAMWLYPSTHDAFIIESFVAATAIYIAGIGFLLMYTSVKHSFNYQYAIKLLSLGLFLAALGFGLLQYMIAVKTNKL